MTALIIPIAIGTPAIAVFLLITWDGFRQTRHDRLIDEQRTRAARIDRLERELLDPSDPIRHHSPTNRRERR